MSYPVEVLYESLMYDCLKLLITHYTKPWHEFKFLNDVKEVEE